MKKIILSLCLIALSLTMFADSLTPAVTKFVVDSTMAVSGARFLQALISAQTWNTIAIIGGVLFIVSEGLALIPSIKANGIFQFIFNILKWVFGNKK